MYKMAAFTFLVKFTYILLPMFICFAYTKAVATSGPYKSIVLKVETCEKVSRPYAKNPPLYASSVAYKVSDVMYINFNLTIRRDTRNVKIRLKSYMLEDSKWIPNYFVNDFGCKGVILPMVVSTLGVKFSSEKCMFLKGSYFLDDLNVNGLQHLWMRKADYGITKWKTEIFNGLGTLSCVEYYVKCVPEN